MSLCLSACIIWVNVRNVNVKGSFNLAVIFCYNINLAEDGNLKLLNGKINKSMSSRVDVENVGYRFNCFQKIKGK